MGRPKAARAANHHNPISTIVPCHRVAAAGGLALKRALLKLEGVCVQPYLSASG